MIDQTPHSNDGSAFPRAHIERGHFMAIWLIPIVAAIIACYLGWHDYAQHGPLVTVTFKTAQGLVAGQTQVKYKAVTLGTVENVHLDNKLENVSVDIRMTGSAEPLLTDHTRLWVIRPQLNTFNSSDIETLVTGSYIQLEPGLPGGKEKRHFTGLENPPADRSDEPGQIFILKAKTLGSINVGSPVYYRDISVGQILGYDVGNGFEPITITAFIRDPYTQYVREQSRFWNASGLGINWGPNGFHLETQSLRAVLAGGIGFYTPVEAQKDVPAEAKTIFTLYESQKSAETAAYRQHMSFVAYFQTSVKDLVPNAPVLIYGIQVGEVTNVKLLFDQQSNEPKVRVDFDIQPERAFELQLAGQTPDTVGILRQLVTDGMRVKLEASSLLTGQKQLVLEFSPNAKPTPIATEGDIIVLPSSGSADNVMDALGDVANKLNQIPFNDIGNNLNDLIRSANQTIGGKEMQQAVHDLSVAMANAADLSRKANEHMTPALQRLPDISAQLQEATAHANTLLTGLDAGYGEGSDFQRSTKRVLDQANDAARSIRLLADFLERHPEALLSGKSYEKEKP